MSTPLQTSYGDISASAKLIAGMPSETDAATDAHILAGTMRGKGIAGRGVFMSALGGPYPANHRQVWHEPSHPVAADADLLLTATASPAADTTYNTTVGRFDPPRKITVTIDTHADWDLTTAVLTYKVGGVSVSENVAIPDGGNFVFTSAQDADSGTASLAIPAQSGTGGSFTIGVAAVVASKALFLGVLRKHPAQLNSASFQGLELYGIDEPADFDFLDGMPVDVTRGGFISVITETAVSDGDDVYVRITAAGAEELGAFRNDADGGDAVVLTGWRFRGSYSAGVASVYITPGMK